MWSPALPRHNIATMRSNELLSITSIRNFVVDTQIGCVKKIALKIIITLQVKKCLFLAHSHFLHRFLSMDSVQRNANDCKSVPAFRIGNIFLLQQNEKKNLNEKSRETNCNETENDCMAAVCIEIVSRSVGWPTKNKDNTPF